LGPLVKVIVGIMRKYGISKGAGIAKSLGFKTKAIGEAGKKAVRQVAKGPKMPPPATRGETAKMKQHREILERYRGRPQPEWKKN